MTTLYVAGPMTGLPEYNYPAFNAAAATLSSLGYGVLNPVDSEMENPNGEVKSWEWYLRRALRMVTEADALALLEGWESSRGAQLEVHVARALGMDCEPVDHWIDGGTK